MKLRTVTGTLPILKERILSYLFVIGNLPKWAAHSAHELQGVNVMQELGNIRANYS
jgi:hypothetical protein